MSDSLQYAIGLETSTAQAAMERFNGTAGTLINRLNDTGSAAGRASAQGNSLAGTLTRLGTAVGFAALIKRGFEFNKTMGDSEAAIGKVISQFQGLNDEAAKAEAAKAMQQLIDLEPKAAGSLSTLVNGFLSTLASSQAAGLSVKENIDLVGRFANAMANANIPTEQLGQEMRSIVTGTIGADSSLARILGITNEMVDAAKASGDMYGFLVNKIGKLGEAGDTAAVAFSSLQSATDKVAGALASGFFDAALVGAKGLTQQLEESLPVFEQFGQGLAMIADLGIKLGSAMKYAATAVADVAFITQRMSKGASFGEARQELWDIKAFEDANQARFKSEESALKEWLRKDGDLRTSAALQAAVKVAAVTTQAIAADTPITRRKADERYNEEGRRYSDGRKKIRGVQTPDTYRTGDGLSRDGPLVTGPRSLEGGLLKFRQMQEKVETPTTEQARPGYRRGQMVPVVDVSLTGRRLDVGERINNATGAPATATRDAAAAARNPNAAPGQDATLTKLDAILAELTRIRTA